MKTINNWQTLTNMEEGRIYYYCEVKENDEPIRCDKFSIKMEEYTKLCNEHPDYVDTDLDAIVVKKAYSEIYKNEYFKVIVCGEDKSDERPDADQMIRQELESKNYSLQDLFLLLDVEENNFKSLTGILRLTAKFKMIVINELITKAFNELEEEYNKYERGLI